MLKWLLWLMMAGLKYILIVKVQCREGKHTCVIKIVSKAIAINSSWCKTFLFLRPAKEDVTRTVSWNMRWYEVSEDVYLIQKSQRKIFWDSYTETHSRTQRRSTCSEIIKKTFYVKIWKLFRAAEGVSLQNSILDNSWEPKRWRKF